MSLSNVALVLVAALVCVWCPATASLSDPFSVVFVTFIAGPDSPREYQESAQLEDNLRVLLYPSNYGTVNTSVFSIAMVNYTAVCDAHLNCVPSGIYAFSGFDQAANYLALASAVAASAASVASSIGVTAIAMGGGLFGTSNTEPSSSSGWVVPTVVAAVVLVVGGIGMWVFARWFIKRSRAAETALMAPNAESPGVAFEVRGDAKESPFLTA